MYIANATGCSSIWGGSAPSTPYTVNKQGPRPRLGELPVRGQRRVRLRHEPGQSRQRRDKLIEEVETLCDLDFADEDIVAAGKAWLESMDDPAKSRETGDKLVALIEDCFAHQDLTGTPCEEQWLANGKDCGCHACTAARAILERQGSA